MAGMSSVRSDGASGEACGQVVDEPDRRLTGHSVAGLTASLAHRNSTAGVGPTCGRCGRSGS